MNLGLIGCSKIAAKVLKTLQNLDEINLFACSSREKEKLDLFKKEFGFKKTYLNYEDLINDKEVDFIYITLINTLHYQYIKRCIEKGKAVICEKPFTMTYKEAKEVISLAKAKNVLLMDATWTRYMPYIDVLKKIINSNQIGNVYMISANLGYSLLSVDRVTKKELGGGSLLDLGVYPLNFIFSLVGSDYINLKSTAKIVGEVERSEVTTFNYPNGLIGLIYSTIEGDTNNTGYIYGDKGYIKVKDVNNPSLIEVYETDGKLLSTIKLTHQYSGYEYEFIELIDLIKNKKIESPKYPHKEILKVQLTLDKIKESYLN